MVLNSETVRILSEADQKSITRCIKNIYKCSKLQSQIIDGLKPYAVKGGFTDKILLTKSMKSIKKVITDFENVLNEKGRVEFECPNHPKH